MSNTTSGGVESTQSETADTFETDRRLLEFLVCPLTKSPLSYDSAKQELISKRARLAFPIRNGVPLMTLDSARALDDVP